MIQSLQGSQTRPVPRTVLLGCGTVGSEVAARMLECSGRASAAHQLVGVLVRDTARHRALPPGLVTSDPDEVFALRPDLVIEVIGGVQPACALVTRALEQGIPVVTANKTLIAHRGRELALAARRSGAGLAFEATVCAGVPVLGALRRLRGDRIASLQGVVNGTCNAILTRMEAGLSREQALAEAQRLGLAEADPSADLSGRDSAEKLCILAAAAGLARLGELQPQDVACEGIEAISREDITEARAARRVIRLVAEIDASSGTLRVGPALLPRDHPLAQLEGAENGIVVQAHLAGKLVFRGPGAGPRPTASAILSDAARLLRRRFRPADDGAPRPGRRSTHYVRIAGRCCSPDPALEALAHHQASVSELSFGRGRLSALVALDEPAARECARELAAREGPWGEALVMPLLA